MDCCKWGGVSCNNHGESPTLLDVPNLHGGVPNFTGCQSLMMIGFGSNLIKGKLSDFTPQLPNVEILSLYDNLLDGNIPDLTGCKFLVKLDLRKNQLSCNLHTSIGQLANLLYLDLSDNVLKGVITDVHFQNLTQLSYLGWSHNSLAIELSFSVPFQLYEILLRSCKLGPSFLLWLKTQTAYMKYMYVCVEFDEEKLCEDDMFEEYGREHVPTDVEVKIEMYYIFCWYETVCCGVSKKAGEFIELADEVQDEALANNPTDTDFIDLKQLRDQMFAVRPYTQQPKDIYEIHVSLDMYVKENNVPLICYSFAVQSLKRSRFLKKMLGTFLRFHPRWASPETNVDLTGASPGLPKRNLSVTDARTSSGCAKPTAPPRKRISTQRRARWKLARPPNAGSNGAGGFLSQDASLWHRLIAVLYGNRSPFVHTGSVSSLSPWNCILKELNSLSAKGINLLALLKKKVGNGANTLFWEDCWINDVPLSRSFPCLYALELKKGITVADKLIDASFVASFHRNPRGGVEEEQLHHLVELVGSISLSPSNDRWAWLLGSSGEFSVHSARTFIDDILLPFVGDVTRWVKVVPIKVNILAWKVCLDKLPTRLNLSLRGIDIPSIICPNCGLAGESCSHLFYSCNLARTLWRKIARWWEIDIPDFSCYEEWIAWFKTTRFSKAQKEMLEGVFYVMWWMIWKFRNQVLFGSSHPRMELLFDDIEFAIKDLGDLSYFLGLEVSYTNDGLFLSQAKYATDVLTRAALLDSKPVSTPLAANEVFVTGGSLFANPTLYRSLVGALQYLTITRPDLSYAVNQASQFLHAPTDAHFQSVKRILRYVKGTITYGLIFRRPHSNSILGYSDADWARCIETRRSTYGYSIFLGGNLVSWSAKKQPTVSRSSCESEYRAMANTAAEIIWITHLLRELHALPPDRPTLLCDNKSALFMSQNLDRETKQVIAQGLCEDGLYVLRDTPMALAATVGVSRKASFELWHNRLGHVSFDVISTLNKLGVLDVTSILPKPNICKPCQLSKSQRLPFELNSKRSSYPLDLIHCDLWGPAPVSSDGYLYYVIFVDDYSRFTWFYPLKTKSGFYTVLSAFIKLVQTQLSRKIKVFQSDGGTEFVNHTVRKIFEDNGTLHRLSCPYTPQQNGRAERKHRHLVETGLAMLFHAHVPASYWVDAFSSATYIINRLPTKLLGNHSPFELLYSRLPNYTNFRAFGCLVYPYLRDYSAHKLAPRSIPCVFIGYNPQYKGYKCLDPDSSRIYITRHARFDEVTFPFASTANPNALSTLQLCTFLEDGPPISDAPVPESRPTDTRPSSSSPCGLCPVPTTAAEPIHEPDSTPSSPYSSEDDNPPTDSDDVSSHGAPPAPPATAPTEPSSVHQMKTRSKSGIFKTKHSPDFVSLTSHALHAALFSLVQPKGFKSAAKHPQWMAAMHDEMEALKQNCTWTLVPRPSASNIVGSKWVYRIKYHADGSVERFKARVVAQGFTQIPGLDYSHTFSPVVKASTVRIVLSLAVLHRWRLHQLDVKNAFLHGHLNETVYMEQPPGFIDPQFPNHVCKLSKALYGLKQAPRAWFHRLSSFLLAHGFVCSRADTSLFVFTKDSCIMYLLVYVDDLILTGNNESLLTSFTTRLNQEFAIKDLGDLSYFLGLEVSYTNDGLFLSQAKYATDVLTRAALLDSKPVSTPLAANEVFVTGGSLFANPTLYRSLVGALQYLTITRPDLSYAVNQASQFLHAPTDAHFQSVKRILRYVKGTITYGLIFRRPHSNSILGYSDADWARCIETRRSTYGYSIFLGGNLVSWSAKKQPTVSRSSCESEYRAMANTAAEIIWITHLLRELHALPPDRPTLLCDNKSALFMSQNPVSHKRAKHIDLDYHFVRELVASGKLYTKFIPTKLQVADIFTKSLPRPQFEYFRSLLRLGPPPIRLRGDIR
ncbi:retrovirus-related pol polyprotein from transposon TNT 1-94 [Tanacetum coccineum]